LGAKDIVALSSKMSNVTYVSFLIHCDDDRVSRDKRLEWALPFFELDANIVLFIDSTYAQEISLHLKPRIKVIELDINTLETVKRIKAAGTLQLPYSRNVEKDTLNFLTLMNCKTELLLLAKDHVKTPYVAYIDAGISKILKGADTLKRLETLNVHAIPLVLLPGCHPIRPVESFPYLWKGIHWMLSGGFFVVPNTCVDELYELHLNSLQKFLDIGAITWEVNVWASFANSVKSRIVWYNGPHTDEMITGIPKNVLLI